MTAIASTMMQRKFLIYMLTIVFIQFFVYLILFEFIRKPWQGVETKAEQAENIEDERLFSEISRYGSSDFTQINTFAENTTIGNRKHQEKVTADEKYNALKAAYEDRLG